MKTVNIKNQDFAWGWPTAISADGSLHKHSWFLAPGQAKRLEFVDYKFPDNCGLRIFKDKDWQGTSFFDAARIQNIFWVNGMAPRVRDVINLSAPSKRYRFAHVVEYVSLYDESSTDFQLPIDKLEKVARDNFVTIYRGDHDEVCNNLSNWRNGLYLDFGGFSIDWDRYKEKLVREIIEVTHFGKSYKGGKASYQSVPSWGLDGKRKTDYRIEKLGLNSFDFSGKSVLDIGCNLGIMLHYASAKGASSLTGYDRPNVVKVAREMANLEDIFNIDFYGIDLTRESPKDKADVVLYLAVSDYFGFPKWLGEVTGETLFYEGHAGEKAEATSTQLGKLFPHVSYIGNSEDRSIRPLFVCHK